MPFANEKVSCLQMSFGLDVGAARDQFPAISLRQRKEGWKGEIIGLRGHLRQRGQCVSAPVCRLSRSIDGGGSSVGVDPWIEGRARDQSSRMSTNNLGS